MDPKQIAKQRQAQAKMVRNLALSSAVVWCPCYIPYSVRKSTLLLLLLSRTQANRQEGDDSRTSYLTASRCLVWGLWGLSLITDRILLAT